MTKINDIITNENGAMYAGAAAWCNDNDAVLEEIEQKDGVRRFRVVPVPEATDDEKREVVRMVRNGYLEETDKSMIADFPITEEERVRYRAYRQYLRDYTKTDGWFDARPMTFETWKTDKN